MFDPSFGRTYSDVRQSALGPHRNNFGFGK